MHKEQLSYIVQHRDFDSDVSRLADLAAALTTVSGMDNNSSSSTNSGTNSPSTSGSSSRASGHDSNGDESDRGLIESKHELQQILEELNVQRRLELSLFLLKKELELARLQNDIGKKVEEKISASQRRYFLQEQLKSIKKELGMEKDEKSALCDKFRSRFDKVRSSASDEVVTIVDEEIMKLSTLESSSSEFSVTRNYLDWLTSIQWGVEVNHNIIDSSNFDGDINHDSSMGTELKRAQQVLVRKNEKYSALLDHL